ncbi:hypothetical protein SLEP1_g24154 [Rubroshorea leprosula]|uniref:Uncharacterized protein n=1 Tax=Rubroshorea leprosula TaxID=152421 RepID=A0AAV5JEP4_9ROSI|nr:hypothetical protein SLEP1_g24154 [Rubroshorea leprosula]
MADPHLPPQAPAVQVPLLNSNNYRENQGTDLDRVLDRLEKFLTFLGFKQSSALSFLLFVVVGVLLLVLMLEFSQCSGCEKYQITNFELDIVASQTCLATISLLCLSHFLRKYGIRKFLFVDRSYGHVASLNEKII